MSCSQTLSGIAQDCESSMGGIVEAYAINHDDVASVTITDNQVSAITLAGTNKFKKYYFRAGTSSFTSTLNVDAANGVNYVSTDVVLLFSKMDTAKRIEMQALATAGLAMIVKDSNGKLWYFGYSEPVYATAGDGQTGTAKSDGNRYSITLQDNCTVFPYEIASTLDISEITD